VKLRSWPGFPWQAFAATSPRGALANSLTAYDQDDQPVVLVELSWSYDPPCFEDDVSACVVGGTEKAWAEARDPIHDESGADESDHSLVFAQPAVRRILAGRTFFIGGSTGWVRCDGSSIGSVVSFRVWPPVSFTGEIPYHDYAKEGENVAYREGRAYVEAERVSSVEAWVDRSRHRVVGIDLDAFDDTEGALEDEPQIKIKKFEPVEKAKSAGGHDDSSQCPEPGD
jgi:hypothetical protein